MPRTQIEGGDEEVMMPDGSMEPYWAGKYDREPVNWKDPLHLPWPDLWKFAAVIFVVTFVLAIVLLWLADVFPI